MKFDQRENGNFIHYILENILKNTDYQNEQVSEYTKQYIDKYADEYFAKNLITDVKFEYILNNLKQNTHKIVCNIIEEIEASKFKPVDFELEISKYSDVKPLKISDFSIIGKVDRIDLYKDENSMLLRIIDYKSGVKKLDLSHFHHGLNMQMFIYMLAVECSEFYERKNYDVNSVGALYIPTKMPKISANKPLSLEEKQKKVIDDLKRSGILIKDKKIIRDMEINEPFLYLPVKFNKDESFSKISSSVASLARIDATKNLVIKKLNDTVLQIKEGKIDVDPYELDNRSSCDYCKYTNCCGFSSEYDAKRAINSLKIDEFWESIGVGGEEFE